MLRPMTRNVSALVVGIVIGALAAAAPAGAALRWNTGSMEESTVSNCNFDPETGIVAIADFQADPAALPRVGDVFYVRTVAGRVGNGCGIGMRSHVELVPPPGVTLAISPSTPLRCGYMDIDTAVSTPAANCPQAGYDGVYGPAFDQLTPAGPNETYPWDVPYGKALVVEVPLRSSRPLAGTAPACSRLVGDPPCAADRSGDALQFSHKIIDGWASPWLSPYVPLFVEPGPAGGGAVAAPRVRAAAAVRLRTLRRGLRIRVGVARSGSRVAATLVLPGARRKLVLARGVIRNATVGTVRLRLEATKAGLRALRRVRLPLSSRLSVVVTAQDGTRGTAKRSIKVKR